MPSYIMESPTQDGLTLQEACSGIMGSVSLAIWIFLLVPQLILNYRTGNADGVSLMFLCVWMIGDLANLIGAIWASLVPTVVTIAIYFCFTDVVLVSQSFYYKNLKSIERTKLNSNISTTHSEPTTGTNLTSENTPLFSEARSDPTLVPERRGPSDLVNYECANETKRSQGNTWIFNTVFILVTIFVGILGWVIAYLTEIWTPIPVPSNSFPSETIISTPIGAQIFGYLSAIFYLSARIPQIMKNYRDKSCEGLSLLFFILSLLGNATYTLSIICHSLQPNYLLTNLPWLIGSSGTMFEDVIIFIQFRHYSSTGK
ncbi:putative vacuolar amino acid transporter YPQ1 [Golovinomyces cichoracearum]|uniref:Putative vacuolar amino acid transporter YPQ1 n=1 Tax=Golovinomyces cichoracearum TaxID=62708 RepID=A0A420HXY1_9PEZI|nr:putative vacuolar amino acid transporter YPQ1 [Golovinomyces cichoracearum]